MECRFHPCQSNLVGVCASCLRERLEALVSEKERRRRVPSPLSLTSSSSADCPSSAFFTTTTTATFTSCPDFSLPLPRSAAPYVGSRDRHSFFFSPHHLNPTAKESNKKKHRPEIPNPNSDHDISTRKSKKKLSFLYTFFGRRQKKSEGSCADARVPEPSSLFSKILTGRHRKTPPIATGIQQDFLP